MQTGGEKGFGKKVYLYIFKKRILVPLPLCTISRVGGLGGFRAKNETGTILGFTI